MKKTHKNIYHKNHNNKTKRREPIIELSGHIVENKNGWKTICIYGSPYDRGFAHLIYVPISGRYAYPYYL